jgi:flagellar assembly protein FliH
MSQSAALRRPSFLEQAKAHSAVVTPAFGGAAAPPAVAEARGQNARLRVVDIPELVPSPLPQEIHLPPPAMPTSPAAPAPAPAAPDMSRINAAIERLRLMSERLAAEARADAMEVALLVARKMVEGELSVNVERMLGTVRSAVRRLGESRRILIRVCPADAELMTGAGAGARSPADIAGSGVARVELVADPTLGRGDCVVEGELGSVDARLDSRFDEIRRALVTAAMEDQA